MEKRAPNTEEKGTFAANQGTPSPYQFEDSREVGGRKRGELQSGRVLLRYRSGACRGFGGGWGVGCGAAGFEGLNKGGVVPGALGELGEHGLPVQELGFELGQKLDRARSVLDVKGQREHRARRPRQALLELLVLRQLVAVHLFGRERRGPGRMEGGARTLPQVQRCSAFKTESAFV